MTHTTDERTTGVLGLTHITHPLTHERRTDAHIAQSRCDPLDVVYRGRFCCADHASQLRTHSHLQAIDKDESRTICWPEMQKYWMARQLRCPWCHLFVPSICAILFGAIHLRHRLCHPLLCHPLCHPLGRTRAKGGICASVATPRGGGRINNMSNIFVAR